MRRGTQGHVAEPREPTQHKVAQTRGRGHASPRGRPGGATWHEGGWQVEGPRVSGPWLVVSGGNEMRLAAPPIIHDILSLFFRVGLCSRRNLSLQDMWRRHGRWMRITSRKARRLSGPESPRSPSRARAQWEPLIAPVNIRQP